MSSRGFCFLISPSSMPALASAFTTAVMVPDGRFLHGRWLLPNQQIGNFV